jgi:hypothetical protein
LHELNRRSSGHATVATLSHQTVNANLHPAKLATRRPYRRALCHWVGLSGATLDNRAPAGQEGLIGPQKLKQHPGALWGQGLNRRNQIQVSVDHGL